MYIHISSLRRVSEENQSQVEHLDFSSFFFFFLSFYRITYEIVEIAKMFQSYSLHHLGLSVTSDVADRTQNARNELVLIVRYEAA